MQHLRACISYFCAHFCNFVSIMHQCRCRAAAIHGDMDQASRAAVLSEFKAGRHHVLVASDVAARGLDIK
jgi:superfamily II DNA/RNA helicase